MAILKMNKFTLLSFESSKEPLLKEFQKFENVHFKDLQTEELEEFELLQKDSASEVVSGIESEIAKIKFVMEKIEPFAEIPKGMQAMKLPMPSMSFDEFDAYSSKYDFQKPYEALKEKDEELKALKAEKNKILAEIDNYKCWSSLDISLADVSTLKTIEHITGTINKNLQESFRESFEREFSDCYLEFLGNIKDELTLMVIVHSDNYDNAMNFLKNAGFSRSVLNFKDTPENLIKAGNSRLSEIVRQEETIESGIKDFAGEYSKLEIMLDYYNTSLARSKATENFLCSEKVTVMEGWVPKENISEFESIVNKVCGNEFHIDIEEVEYESTEVPIKLKNNSIVSAFEGITAMYSFPKYNEIDPTGVLAPFYIAFFGLMVGDMGYGLVLLLATMFAMKLPGMPSGTKQFMKMFFILSFSIIVSGAIYGSFFGFAVFKPLIAENGNPKAILDIDWDITNMLIISVIIGVFQIVVGLLVKGYMLVRDGRAAAALCDSIAWITTLFGGIGMLIGVAMPDYSGVFEPSKWMFIISVVVLACTQGRESPSLGGKIGNGIYAVYGLTGYVGDIVSYTRITALMLSGAYIAYSFNEMAKMTLIADDGSLMAAGFIAAPLIFLFGAALNFALALLGAYVHTCRLQYVEYFSKFYEGGGKVFQPLELKNTHIEIKK